MGRVGSMEWATATGGRLRLRDRVDLLVVQGVPTLLSLAWRNVGGRLGLVRPVDAAPLGQVVPYIMANMPDTPVAREADALCREVSDGDLWLVNHCYRTFGFGLLLGAGLSVDPEKLFVMSMLHDVGLTARYEQGADPGLVSGYTRSEAPCFAVRGAGVAERLGAEFGATDPDELAAAICRHVNMRVAKSHGIEAHLLNAGSALDVAGLRYGDLPSDAIDSIGKQWPRGERFRDSIWKAWGCEAGVHPECRGRFINTWGRFRKRIYTAPFRDAACG